MPCRSTHTVPAAHRSICNLPNRETMLIVLVNLSGDNYGKKDHAHSMAEVSLSVGSGRRASREDSQLWWVL